MTNPTPPDPNPAAPAASAPSTGKLYLEVGPGRRNQIVETDALGNAKPQEVQPAMTEGNTRLIPFEDSALFRAFPNKNKPGTYILADAAGTQVAVACDRYIADILCKGARLFFASARVQAAMQAAAQEEAKPKIIAPH